MKIAFIYAEGRNKRYAEVVQGNGATEFLYGAIEMERRGHVITRYEIGPTDTSKPWFRFAELLYLEIY